MKQLTDEIRLQIFQQNIGGEVIIKPWSNAYNEKATMAPEYKKGEIEGVVKGFVYVKANGFEDLKGFSFKDLIILKRPLSSITDEEAREIAKLSGSIFSNEAEIYFSTPGFYGIWIKNDADKKDRFIMWNQFSLAAYQYIHLIGIALPYLDWSVEELIKENVYKLIE